MLQTVWILYFNNHRNDVSLSEGACVSNPCLNGGQCIDVPESASQPIYAADPTSQMLNYNCRCLDRWTGTNCETELIGEKRFWVDSFVI